MAIPAGDGIPNLLKYALNLNPKAPGASGLPVAGLISTGSGNFMTLTYTQAIAASDITYVPEVSSDLQTWNSGVGYVAPFSVTNNGDGVTETVIVEDLLQLSGTGRHFMRLMITRP